MAVRQDPRIVDVGAWILENVPPLRTPPLLTDACVNDHLVQALRALGWDVVRAIDLYPERTNSMIYFMDVVKHDDIGRYGRRPRQPR